MQPLVTNENDQAIWAAMRTGDESAFDSLYNHYFQVLLSYGKKLASDEIVRDAIQNLFVNIWRNRRSLSQADSVRFYLFRSLRREIVKNLKSELFHEGWESVDESQLPVELPYELTFTDQEDMLRQSELISRWLEQLPSRQNEALLLRYYHNLEYPQVASILNIKEQTARNLVQKALAILRKVAIVLIVSLLFF